NSGLMNRVRKRQEPVRSPVVQTKPEEAAPPAPPRTETSVSQQTPEPPAERVAPKPTSQPVTPPKTAKPVSHTPAPQVPAIDDAPASTTSLRVLLAESDQGHRRLITSTIQEAG